MTMMRMFRTSTGAVVLALSAVAAVHAEPKSYVVDKNHSSVGFQIRHMVGKVSGRFNDFDGKITADPAKPETGSVEFTIKAASITTDNERRDTHLRSADFFEVEKYPEISFKSEKIVPKGKDEYEVSGPLTMHGVTKAVVLPVKMLGTSGDLIGLEVQTVLNRKDYGIVWNKVLDTGGVQLGDDVTVSINLEVRPPRPEGARRPAGAAQEAPKDQKEPAPATK
jgi:polyisoprenoid-binding protein YceI